MDAACIRHTELPGTSRLYADYLYSFDRVARFYRHAPRSAAGLTAAAAEALIDYPDSRRAAIAAALRAQNGGQSTPNLDRFAQPGTVAVVTGQQVGLFSGPAYTIYKALTAVQTARELTAAGTPAVPVFWLASEDHDFAEISKAWLFNTANHPVAVDIKAPAEIAGPVGPVVPDYYPVTELKEALGGFDFADEAIALVEAAYQPGRPLAAAFRALVQSLLAKYDLLYLDPLDPAIRAIGAPFLAASLDRHEELYPALIERGRALQEAGYHAQVHVDGQTSLYFILDGAQRIPLRRQHDRYISREGAHTVTDLKSRAEQLSPNALLRPVLQDYLLPTAAYVGGPAELAYFAQSEVLYTRLLGRMPAMLPRNGFTLVDARSAKLMDRYQFTLHSLFRGEAALKEAIADELLPGLVRVSLEKSKTDVDHSLEKLEEVLTGFDPSLAKALSKSRAKIQYQLGKIERKTAREHLRRDERASTDATHLGDSLYPHHHLQERLYSILPFIAKYGIDLIDRIADHTCLDCVDHHLLPL